MKPLLCCCRFVRDERGVTAIEYALLASLIAVVIAVAVASTGVSVGALFNHVADCVAKAAQGTAC